MKVAELDGNGSLEITTGTERGVPTNEPDTIKVFARHDASGAPSEIVVTVNNNRREEFPAAEVHTVRYDSTGDNRDVFFQVVRTDSKPFEKQVNVQTAGGNDDLFVDTQDFADLRTEGGQDKIIVTAAPGDGGGLIAGGPDDDYLLGGPNTDFLAGEEGNDTIEGGGGADQLFGGPDDDTLMDASIDQNCMVGGDGNDQLLAGRGADVLSGDEGGFLFIACCPEPRARGGRVRDGWSRPHRDRWWRRQGRRRQR